MEFWAGGRYNLVFPPKTIMSAAAIPIYKLLLAKGVGEDEARAAAEAVVAEAETRLAENLQAAKTHADNAVANAVAKSEEKADAKYVSQARFHEMDKSVATRADLSALEKSTSENLNLLRQSMESGFAELRRENRRDNKFTHRVGLGVLLALFALVVKLVIGV